MNDDVAPESCLRLAIRFLDRHRHFDRFASVDRTLLGRQQNREVTLLARELDEFASQRIGFRHQGYNVETQLVGHGKRGVGAKFAVGHQYDVAQHIEHAGQFLEMVAELLDVTDVSVLDLPIQRNPGIAHGHAEQQLLQIRPMVFAVAKCRNRRSFDQRGFDFENRVVIAVDAYRRAVEVDSADFDPKLAQAGKDDGRLKPFRLAVKGVQSFSQTGVIEKFTTEARAAKEKFKIESGQHVLDFRQSVGSHEDRAQHGHDALPVAHNVKFMLRHDFVDHFLNSQAPQVVHQHWQGAQSSTITDRFYRRRCICKIGHDNNTSGMYCRKSALHRAHVKVGLHQFTLSKIPGKNVVHRKCGIYNLDLTTTYQHELGLPPETVFWSSNSGGASLAYVLRRLSITGNDRVLDVGCGKGGALITLADFPFGRVAGVELSETLVEIARKNLNKLCRNDIAIFCYNALEFTGYDDYNYIYMYNPFPVAVMTPFLKALVASLQRVPRTLRIIYKNPTCHDAIVGSGIFDFVKQIQEYNDHPYNIYQNVGKK